MRFRGWRLARWGSESKRRTAVRGRIENASRGGISVVSAQSLPVYSLVQCEILTSPSAGAIPTVMQVRWNQKSGSGKEHRMGLRFVL
jgi:c-di-GMP-binding flagellar brake protein YcgR